MITTYKAAANIDVLTSSFPIPGMGFVPINAFVLHGTEPILVDTGCAPAFVGPDQTALEQMLAQMNAPGGVPE